MASKDSKARKPTSHPPYAERRFATLKERSGSIPYAIGKYIEDKHKGHLPSNFRKFLSVQLKKLTAEGKLTKVKNSYKLSTPEKANPKVKPAVTDTKSKSKAKTKPAGVGVKPKPKAAAKPKPKTTPKRTGKAAKKDAMVKVEEKRKSQSNPKTKTVAASAKIAKTTRMDTLRKRLVAPRNPTTTKKSKAVKAALNFISDHKHYI